MTVVDLNCPNCGAPAHIEENRRTKCLYCQSPLYLPGSENVAPDPQETTRRRSRKGANPSTRSKSPPVLVVVIWVAVCLFMAASVGGSQAFIPAFMGVFGAFLMLSSRRRKR